MSDYHVLHGDLYKQKVKPEKKLNFHITSYE